MATHAGHATPYAELDLSRPVETSAGMSRTLVVMRPSAGILMSTIDARTPMDAITNFLSKACKARVDGGELVDIKGIDLDVADAGDLTDVIQAMSRDADDAPDAEGDGLDTPMVYTLAHPVQLTEDQTVRQIEFKAKKLGEVADFLNARGATEEFLAFMRNFGRILGLGLPMTDSFSRALDFFDYLVIKDKYMGKLAVSRRRWKKL